MPVLKKSSNSFRSLGCLCLFALPFAGVGVFMGYLTVATLVEWVSMRSWVRVDAEIVSVNLQQNSGSDSTTYEVTASYRYVYDGQEYTGSRVALHAGSDNIGDYHQNTYRELSGYRGETFRCFVDPSSPTEAVLYRDLRYGLVGFYLLFVVLFGGAGFGLVAAGLVGSRKTKRHEELEALHPDEPWLQNEDWHEGRIHSSTKAAFITSAVFAGVWNLISMPVVVFAHEQIFDPDNRVALVALLFPVVGIGLVVWAARSLIRWRKFGESIFEMRTIPGVIGGPLEGTIRTSVNVRPEAGFDVMLSSIHRYRSGSGKSRSTHEKVLWQKLYRAALDRSSAGIPIAFQVPYDCEPTEDADADNQRIWKLEVKAEVEGVDYHVQFEVPVFRTEHSSPLAPDPSDGVDPPFRVDVPLAEQLRKSGARVEHLASGRRFVFPMARHVGSALALTLFFAVLTGITVGPWYSDAPRLFPWVFGLFDVLIFLGVLDMWFFSSRIDVREGGLSFAAGLFGGRRRELSRTDIEKVAPKRGMQSGNKLFYQIEILEHGGKTHVAAKRLPDLDTAERLAAEIEKILGDKLN